MITCLIPKRYDDWNKDSNFVDIIFVFRNWKISNKLFFISYSFHQQNWDEESSEEDEKEEDGGVTYDDDDDDAKEIDQGKPRKKILRGGRHER
jgi:hypothetical protein